MEKYLTVSVLIASNKFYNHCMFGIKEQSISVDISTSSKQKESLFTAVILLSVFRSHSANCLKDIKKIKEEKIEYVLLQG